MSGFDFKMKSHYENTMRSDTTRITLCFNGRDIMNLLTKSFLIALGSIADYIRNCWPKRDDVSPALFDTLIIDIQLLPYKVLRKCNSPENVIAIKRDNKS